MRGKKGRGRGGRRGLCVGSEGGGGRAGTWTGCHSDNLELGLAGLLMSDLFRITWHLLWRCSEI